jgi:hypothetical protein
LFFEVAGHCLLGVSVWFAGLTSIVDDSFIGRYHFLILNDLNLLGIPYAKIVHRHNFQSGSTHRQSLNSSIQINRYDSFGGGTPMHGLLSYGLESTFGAVVVATEE